MISSHGRIVSATLIELEDGEFSVAGIIEMFEDRNQIELKASRCKQRGF